MRWSRFRPVRPDSRRLKVLIATRIYAPEPAAASFRLQALARALGHKGALVKVLTTSVYGLSDQAANQAAAVSRVQISRHRVLRDKAHYVRGYLQYLSFDVPLVWRLLRHPRPDVVVSEPPPTTGAAVRLVCGLRRVPYVYYAADVWSAAAGAAGAPGLVVRALRAVEAWVLRGAAQVLAVSEDVAGQVLALGARPEQVTVVPNGINTAVFCPQAGVLADGGRLGLLQAGGLAGGAAEGTTQAAGAGSEDSELAEFSRRLPPEPYLIYAGTTSEWQGADIFISALLEVIAAAPDAHLVFLGQGSAWGELERLALQLAPEQIHMIGQVTPQASALAHARAAGALVSVKPGVGYDFAYPTKILAGLACGAPVIYAGPGPAREDIMANDLGWVCDYNAPEIAVAMVAALEEAVTAPAGELAAGRVRRAAWVEENRSLQATGRAAAKAVLAACAKPAKSAN